MDTEINKLLVWAFIFFIGSTIGWCIEVLYRRFLSDTNPERKWINPGFLQGPYLPLYGTSLLVLYLLSGIPMDFIETVWLRKIVLFIIMSLVITLIEFIAGLIFIKKMNILLWDYTNDWCNIMGIICPKYTFYWMLLSACYYFLIHGKVTGLIFWLASHLTFSFFVGMFYGIFCVDLFISLKIVVRVREFARENQVLVRYEEFKEKLARKNENLKIRASFMFPFLSAPRITKDSFKDLIGTVKEKVSDSVGNFTDNVGNKIKSVVPGKKNKDNDNDEDAGSGKDTVKLKGKDKLIAAEIKRMESEE